MRNPQKARHPPALDRTTPVPHWLLDEAMPLLSDTELRVLLVVTRSTLGWREGEGRKESDWLSHRQLQARTGRSSAVVSRAINGLVKRGMLVVTNALGEPLVSAGARSRARGRLFFRVKMSKEWKGLRSKSTDRAAEEDTDDSLADEAQPSTASKIEATDGHNALPGTESASESKACQAEPTCETVPQNLRTTKETGTKENKNAGGRVITLTVPTLENEVSAVAPEDWPLLNTIKPRMDSHTAGSVVEKADSIMLAFEGDHLRVEDELGMSAEARHFLQSFQQAYKTAKPGGKPLRLDLDPATRTLLEQRLKQYSNNELEAWLPRFFECTFGYVRRRHWSLESYLESFQLLRAAESIRMKKRSQVDTSGWTLKHRQ